MIIFYSQSCESCAGNHSLNKMKQICKKQKLDFQERRIIFWKVWEKEADEIIKLNKGLKLPFFYNSDTGSVMEGTSLTPLETLQNWIDKNKNV